MHLTLLTLALLSLTLRATSIYVTDFGASIASGYTDEGKDGDDKSLKRPYTTWATYYLNDAAVKAKTNTPVAFRIDAKSGRTASAPSTLAMLKQDLTGQGTPPDSDVDHYMDWFNIWIGTNDIGADGSDADAIFGKLQTLYETALKGGRTVMAMTLMGWAGILDPNNADYQQIGRAEASRRNTVRNAVNSKIVAYAQAHAGPYLGGHLYHMQMDSKIGYLCRQDGAKENPGQQPLFAGDGKHLTEAGYQAVAGLIGKCIGEIFVNKQTSGTFCFAHGDDYDNCKKLQPESEADFAKEFTTAFP